MAEPAVVLGTGPADCGGGLPQQVVVDAQRQPLARLARGAVGEGPAAEMNDVAAGGVAVEDLEQEEVDGPDWVEEALAPGVALAAAGVLDGLGGQMSGVVWSQALQDGQDAWRHGGLLSVAVWGRNPPPECRKSLPCSRRYKSFSIATLPLSSWHSQLPPKNPWT